MDSFLHRLGFTNIHHFVSGTHAYPQCLCDATIEVLEANMDDTPVLVLEDDIEQMPGSSFQITIPTHTDAVYLGLSRSAGHPTENRHCGNAVLEVGPTPDLVRVLNMLSGHAIVYCSRRYKQAVVSKLKEKKTSFYNDVLMSQIQYAYSIYAPLTPVFYQSSALNDGRPHEEWATKIVVQGSPPQLPSA